jgi:hypothetical protein
VLSSRHDGEDEDELVLDILDEGVRAGVWAVLGLRLLGCSAGFCWADAAGKVQVGLLPLFLLFIFCFIPCFEFWF